MVAFTGNTNALIADKSYLISADRTTKAGRISAVTAV